jgi:hypothetical protein
MNVLGQQFLILSETKIASCRNVKDGLTAYTFLFPHPQTANDSWRKETKSAKYSATRIKILKRSSCLGMKIK